MLFKTASYSRGLTMEQAHAQAVSDWLGEPDEERDRDMEEFARFRKMLAEAEADKEQLSWAFLIRKLFREHYGESTTSTSHKKGTKLKP